MPPEWIHVTNKILLSIFLSGVIGLEREVRNKMADLRTHILVGVGSTLVILTSLYLYDVFKAEAPSMDPTRIMSGLITGIGFLCAGTIIKTGEHVIGLTTAATLWIVSCIGMAVGAGHYSGAIIGTVLVLLVLTLVRYIERLF